MPYTSPGICLPEESQIQITVGNKSIWRRSKEDQEQARVEKEDEEKKIPKRIHVKGGEI